MNLLTLVSRREVENMLEKYPSYKRSMEELPSCVPSYEERVQGGESEFISSTEKYAFIRIERRRLVTDVELALSFLTDKEKKLIHLTYFQEDKPLINIVWQQLFMSKSTYYRQRDSILDKMYPILVGTFETSTGTFGTTQLL